MAKRLLKYNYTIRTIKLIGNVNNYKEINTKEAI